MFFPVVPSSNEGAEANVMKGFALRNPEWKSGVSHYIDTPVLRPSGFYLKKKIKGKYAAVRL